jgi:hypothetical protein
MDHEASKSDRGNTRKRIVGIPLNATELKRIPEAQRFHFSAKPRIIQDVRKILTVRGTGGSPPNVYICPTGGEDVTNLVNDACSVGPADQVAVECIKKHWAQYPCKVR